jgi:hypothetical protein
VYYPSPCSACRVRSWGRGSGGRKAGRQRGVSQVANPRGIGAQAREPGECRRVTRMAYPVGRSAGSQQAGSGQGPGRLQQAFHLRSSPEDMSAGAKRAAARTGRGVVQVAYPCGGGIANSRRPAGALRRLGGQLSFGGREWVQDVASMGLDAVERNAPCVRSKGASSLS